MPESGLIKSKLSEFHGHLDDPTHAEVYAIVEDPQGKVSERAVVRVDDSGHKIVFVGALIKTQGSVTARDMDTIAAASMAEDGILNGVDVIKFGGKCE